MCPHAIRKVMAAIHSSVLSRVSRAKSWRCVTRRAIRYVRRALDDWELMRIALGVMLLMVRSRSGGALAEAGVSWGAMLGGWLNCCSFEGAKLYVALVVV